MKARAITGIGVASTLGLGGASDVFVAMGSAPPAPTPIASFDATKYEDAPLIEVPSFDPTPLLGDKGLRSLDRLTKLLLVAARLSLRDAGLKTYPDFEKANHVWTALSPDRVGVCCSNAYGSLEAITELDRVALLEDARYINPSKFPNTVSNTASGYVSIWEDLRALNISVSDGNCGALDAVSCADLCLEMERADAILTGGGESMSEALYLAFEKLGVLSNKKINQGARLGEGAAFLVLEPMEKATARGAKVLASIVGYGTAFIAPEDDVTLLFASSEALTRSIAQAIEDAGITAADVDLVVSGISGIVPFDREERRAIEKALGTSTPITAPKKTMFGETLGASAALSMVAACAWLDGTAIDAASIVSGGNGAAAPKKLDVIVVTAIGYYGNASAVVMRRVPNN